MTQIQLKRQGVSSTVNGTFLPCQHGHSWFIEIASYQGVYWFAEMNYPNCHECYSVKAGQIAWSNHNTKHATTEAAQAEALQAIARRVGAPVEFAPDVEAYMYYSAADLRIWPHIASDVYVLACSYEPATNTIRHEPTNVCLIAFEGATEARFDIDRAAEPYRAEIDRVYVEFLKSHNQRAGEYEAKCWLAWLLSEYIKKSHIAQKPVRRRFIARHGDGTFAGPESLNESRMTVKA
jgi:hypothetical protein